MKVALVAFQGEAMCFAHVLLNAREITRQGGEAAIIIEGLATRLPGELDQAGNPFQGLYQEVRAAGLIAGVCRACATKTGGLAAVQEQGLRLLDEMQGHPSLAAWLQQGYTLLTF